MIFYTSELTDDGASYLGIFSSLTLICKKKIFCCFCILTYCQTGKHEILMYVYIMYVRQCMLHVVKNILMRKVILRQLPYCDFLYDSHNCDSFTLASCTDMFLGLFLQECFPFISCLFVFSTPNSLQLNLRSIINRRLGQMAANQNSLDITKRI